MNNDNNRRTHNNNQDNKNDNNNKFNELYRIDLFLFYMQKKYASFFPQACIFTTTSFCMEN